MYQPFPVKLKRHGILNQSSLMGKRKGIKTIRYFTLRAHKRSEARKIRKGINPRYELFYKWIKNQLNFDITFESLSYAYIKINGRAKPVPSIKTIYNWYHRGLTGCNIASFIVKRYRKKVRGQSIDGRKSIHKRALILI